MVERETLDSLRRKVEEANAFSEKPESAISIAALIEDIRQTADSEWKRLDTLQAIKDEKRLSKGERKEPYNPSRYLLCMIEICAASVSAKNESPSVAELKAKVYLIADAIKRATE